HEILRVHRRLDREVALLVDGFRGAATVSGELATDAADRRAADAGRRREPIGLVVADPDARDEMRRVTDEPRVVIVVRRSRLSRSRKREAHATRRPGGTGI